MRQFASALVVLSLTVPCCLIGKGESPAAGGAGSAAAAAQKELDALRLKNLSPIPDPRADYVFAADQAKPS